MLLYSQNGKREGVRVKGKRLRGKGESKLAESWGGAEVAGSARPGAVASRRPVARPGLAGAVSPGGRPGRGGLVRCWRALGAAAASGNGPESSWHPKRLSEPAAEACLRPRHRAPKRQSPGRQAPKRGHEALQSGVEKPTEAEASARPQTLQPPKSLLKSKQSPFHFDRQWGCKQAIHLPAVKIAFENGSIDRSFLQAVGCIQARGRLPCCGRPSSTSVQVRRLHSTE